MKSLVKPTAPFLLSTTLTGVCCHFSGMSRTDLIVAILVAAFFAGTVTYGSAFVHARRVHRDADHA